MTVIPSEERVSRQPIIRLASLVAFAVFPAVVLTALFLTAVEDDAVATDFRQFYRGALRILDGETLYPDFGVVPQTIWGGPYPYPPLPALVALPLTALPLEAAGLVAMGLLVLCVPAVLYTLGVRDWRCYGLALLWPPVLSAIQTGNLTLPLALCAALAWTYRDRAVHSSIPVGLALSLKFFLWPLLVWFAATRRFVSVALAVATAALLLVLSWAVILFDGITGYPDRLQRLERTLGEDSYTAYIVGLDLGLSPQVARIGWIALGVGLLVALILTAQHDERSAFMLAIVVALALTPIVWLHYFALLLVVVALAQPRLGVAWFVPLAMVITPGSGHPTPFETAWTLAIAAVTIVLALRSTRGMRRHYGAPAEARSSLGDQKHEPAPTPAR